MNICLKFGKMPTHDFSNFILQREPLTLLLIRAKRFMDRASMSIDGFSLAWYARNTYFIEPVNVFECFNRFRPSYLNIIPTYSELHVRSNKHCGTKKPVVSLLHPYGLHQNALKVFVPSTWSSLMINSRMDFRAPYLTQHPSCFIKSK